MTARTIAGLGCRKDTPAEELVALIQYAAAQAGVTLDGLATPHFKQHDPALRQAATDLNLPLLYIDQAALEQAQPFCPTRSEAAHRATGLHSIAEAAALAATAGHLLAPRVASTNATCAIARTPRIPDVARTSRIPDVARRPRIPVIARRPRIPVIARRPRIPVIARSARDEATQGPQAPPSQQAVQLHPRSQHPQTKARPTHGRQQ